MCDISIVKRYIIILMCLSSTNGLCSIAMSVYPNGLADFANGREFPLGSKRECNSFSE